MAAFLLGAAVFVSAVSAQTHPAADAAVRQSVFNALPQDQRAILTSGDDLSTLIAHSDPAAKEKAVAALQDRLWDFGADPKARAVIGTAFLDLGRADLAKQTAEALRQANPADPGASMLLGRVAQREGRLEDALALYRAVPGGDPQRLLAQTNIRAVEEELQRAGRAPAAAPPARSGSSPVPVGHNGLDAGDLRLVASMFRNQGASGTLARTLQKAAQGDARDLNALRAHGIDFARGEPGQEDAVVVEKKGGAQVVTFSPVVLDNPDKKRAVAQLANGVEQAATQRDYSGVMLALRQWGGRLVGVLVYLELAPGVKLTKDVPEADKRLVSDAIAHENTGQTPFPTPPNREGGALFRARSIVPENAASRRLSVFLYFCGWTSPSPFSPGEFQGDDSKYYETLKSLDQ